MKLLLEINNAVYDDIKLEFLYHSNKLEGSTFNLEQLNVLLDEDKIIGEHSVDDVQETINSLKLFDFIIGKLYSLSNTSFTICSSVIPLSCS